MRHPDAMSESSATLLRENAWLRQLVARLVGPGADADDVVQDVGLLALTSAPHELRSVRGWLTAVARRVVRRRRRRARLAADCAPSVARSDAQPSALEVVARVEAHRRVVDAVLALEEPYRSVVLLRFFEGRMPAAIADSLRCPVATVRTRLARGLQLLRGRLEASLGPRQGWARALGFASLHAPLVPVAGPAGSALGGMVGMGTKKLCCGVGAALAFSLGVMLWCVPPEPGESTAGGASNAAALVVPADTQAAAAARAGDEERAAPERTAIAVAADNEETVADDGTLPPPHPGEVVVLVLNEEGQRVVGARVLRPVPPKAESTEVVSGEMFVGGELIPYASRALQSRPTGSVPLRTEIPILAEKVRGQELRLAAVALTLEKGELVSRVSAPVGDLGMVFGRLVGETVVAVNPDGSSTELEEVGRTGPDGTCRVRAAGATTLLAATARGTSGLVGFDAPAQGAHVVLVVQPAFVVAGTVIDAAGQPLPDAAVEAIPQGGTFPQARRLGTTTDRNGRFRLVLDPFGWHDLVACRQDVRSESLRVEARPKDRAAVRIRMLGAVVLHGVVVGPRGAPCGNALVHVVRADRDPQADPRAQPFATTVATAGDGSFTVQLPSAGDYLAAAQHPQWARGEPTRVCILRATAPPPLRLLLAEAAAMHGTVLWQDGFPVPGARVTASPLGTDLPGGSASRMVGEPVSADVQADGSYRLDGLAPQARYDVTCTPDPTRPYARIERTRVVPSQQDFLLDRAATAAATVRLIVQTPDGRPPEQAEVLVSRRARDGVWQRGEPARVTIDATSQATVGGLERGATYAIELRSTTLGRCRTEPFVAGVDGERVLRAAGPARVVVTVRGPDGRPVLGARVVLRERAPVGLRRDDSVRTTDVLGQARWDSVSVLPWAVFAEADRRRSAEVLVPLEPGKEAAIELLVR